jgi:uncharacterized protein YmfQ (DUF2313 family)
LADVPDRHQRRSGDDYAHAFLTLLPQGQAWPRDPESTLARVCAGLADYWGFVDGRAGDLLERESDPRATFELMTDWERNWGLPDPCIKSPATDLRLRRLILVEYMTLLGAQSRAFFIGVAAKLGYTVTITEHAPYMCGVSHVGDRSGIYNPDDPFRQYWQVGPPEMRFYWIVHVDSMGLYKFYVAASFVGIDRLLRIGTAEELECFFNRWKPAHTLIIFDYSPKWLLDYTSIANSMYIPLGIP